jgi:filamentous hemagglutinin family protein
MNNLHQTQWLVWLTAITAIGLLPTPASGRPEPDDTLGNERSNVQELSPIDFEIEGGAQRGFNLFHSFRTFNIEEGGSVYFITPDGVTNILSRVTGSNPSNILGTLGVDGTANLFFLNPNGILFGPNSSLDIGGSFVATTADVIQFGEQGVFSATDPTIPSSLLTVDPSAFFFNQLEAQSPPSIQNQGFLSVPEGESIALLGGNVVIDRGGYLEALGGRVDIAAVTGIGQVEFNIDRSFTVPATLSRVDVILNNRAVVDVSSAGAGAIAITARQLNLLSESSLLAGIINGNSAMTQAGDINLNAESIRLEQGSGIFNLIEENAIGQAGDIRITTDLLSIASDSQLISSTFGEGDAGDIVIQAQNVSVDNGTLDTSTFRNGDAGTITIDTQGAVSLNGSFVFSTVSENNPEVFNDNAAGNAGDINIRAGSLSATNGSQLNVSTFGQGNAGNITIVVRDVVSFDGGREVLAENGSIVSVYSLAASRIRPNVDPASFPSLNIEAGRITITARSLSLTNGGAIVADTFGATRAGEVVLNIQEQIVADGIGIDGISSGIFSDAINPVATGRGGNVSIRSNTLRLVNGGAIDVRTESFGRGGDITIEVNLFEAIDGGQLITTTTRAGRAGNITLEADRIRIAGFDSTYEQRLERFGRQLTTNQGASSGLFANTNSESSGDGGTIQVETVEMALSDRARITARSEGTGMAGDIQINAVELLESTNSDIETIATNSSGGNINVQAERIQLSGDSDIRTNSAVNGGNIALNAGSILAFDDSDIIASAGEQGGDITLNTAAYFAENYQPNALNQDAERLEGNNRADINATGARSGTITTPDTSLIQNSLTELPDTAIDTDSLLASSCVVRSQAQIGTFIITGPGGLPERPGSTAPSTYPTAPVRSIPDASVDDDRSWQLGDPVLEPQGAYQLEDGRWVLSQECNQEG